MKLTNEEILEIIDKNQEDYKGERDIKLDVDVDLSQFASYADFLYYLVFDGVFKHNTIYVDDSSLQCAMCKNRSTRDLYKLSTYYYPKLTLLEFFKTAMQLQRVYKVGSLHCPHIGRRVWTRYEKMTTESRINKNIEFDKTLHMDYDAYNHGRSKEDAEAGITNFDKETDLLSYNHIEQIYESTIEEKAVAATC